MTRETLSALRECLKSFDDYPKPEFVWCPYSDGLLAPTIGNAALSYSRFLDDILMAPEHERKVRLLNFRPAREGETICALWDSLQKERTMNDRGREELEKSRAIITENLRVQEKNFHGQMARIRLNYISKFRELCERRNNPELLKEAADREMGRRMAFAQACRTDADFAPIRADFESRLAGSASLEKMVLEEPKDFHKEILEIADNDSKYVRLQILCIQQEEWRLTAKRRENNSEKIGRIMQSIEALYRLDVPSGTWDGESIFPKLTGMPV